MPTCCISYTPDASYMFPTFVSAVQARRQASIEKADVRIFSFGVDSAAADCFGRACEAEGIGLDAVPMDAIDQAPAMLARLFLTRFVPAHYEDFLYLDGDTQIIGGLDPLIDACVPPGKFMATNDPMTFMLPGSGPQCRDVAQHFAGLQMALGDIGTYFNSGVLRIRRSGWAQIGLNAWELFQKEGGSRFPDQDVLNIVTRGSRIPMSLAWNFPIFLRNARIEHVIKPRIYHFMSNPKPWQGVFPPWNASAEAPYIGILRRYPELTPYRIGMAKHRAARYQLQQRYKQALEYIAWGLSERRSRILNYEQDLTEASASTAIH